MTSTYLGVLDRADPLYEILLTHVEPYVREPLFHVDKMCSHRVYKYTEEKTQTSVVGKFFGLDDVQEERVYRIMREYDNLNEIRRYGFDRFPNYVVRPISRDGSIGLALTEEFVKGQNLDHFMKEAVYDGKHAVLKEKLEQLAVFLSELHSRTKTDETVKIDSVVAYFVKVLDKLLKQSVISDDERKRYLELMDKWVTLKMLDRAAGSIIHGDATPTNFIFTEGKEVVAIDLERMKRCDPAYDIGMVCGELKHAFLWRTGNPQASEPFIRHFLENYAGHPAAPAGAFEEMTTRTPYYMAMTELRIARNDYLGWRYRKRLAREAMECLKWGLLPG